MRLREKPKRMKHFCYFGEGDKWEGKDLHYLLERGWKWGWVCLVREVGFEKVKVF